MARRGGRRNAASRNAKANNAMQYLETVLLENIGDEDLSKQAAKQLSDMSKRHSISLNQGVNRLICRGCKTPLVSGHSSRVRIRNGVLITTCLNCSRVSRKALGGDSDE